MGSVTRRGEYEECYQTSKGEGKKITSVITPQSEREESEGRYKISKREGKKLRSVTRPQ